jgi:hypothetical protein
VLRDLPGDVDFVYWDGAKTLHRDVLLKPRLVERALIVADNIDMVDVVESYTSYVRNPDNGYLSSRVGFEEGSK